jgi:hypothetical protein
MRLDEELDQALRNRAKEERVTVNSLMNRVLWKFIEWDLPCSKIGMVGVSQVTVTKFLTEVDDEKLTELGKQIAWEFVKPFIEYLYGKLSVDSSILFFKRMSHYANRFEFDATVEGGRRTLVLRHNMSQKWSRYYSGLAEGLYHDLLGKQAKIDSTDELCMVQFPAD